MPKFLSKRVSNYELFFDLAVVLAIGQLTSAMHISHIGGMEIFAFIMANIILFNVWINEVFYFNKYGDSRIHDIYTIIALMFVIGNIALNFDVDFDHFYAGSSVVRIFNLLLMAAYAIIALQYFLKGRKLGFSQDIKLSMWTQIIFALAPAGFALGLIPVNLWTMGLYLIPNLLPLLTQRYFDHRSVNFPHAVERLQLVTILTFGETVIGIIKTYPLSDSLFLGALFFFGMATLFIFYMNQTFLNLNHHQETASTALFYAHLLIFIGVNVFTVGTEFLADHHHADLGFILFFCGIISFYAGVLATSPYNQDIYRLTKKAWLQYGLTLALALSLMLLFRHQQLVLALILIVLNRLMMQFSIKNRRRARERYQIPHPDPNQNIRDFS